MRLRWLETSEAHSSPLLHKENNCEAKTIRKDPYDSKGYTHTLTHSLTHSLSLSLCLSLSLTVRGLILESKPEESLLSNAKSEVVKRCKSVSQATGVYHSILAFSRPSHR